MKIGDIRLGQRVAVRGVSCLVVAVYRAPGGTSCDLLTYDRREITAKPAEMTLDEPASLR